MRKLTAILLLAITCISYTGYYTVCKYQIYLAKEQAELRLLQQLPDSILVKIDASTVNSTDENELWYNNQMYDVVKQVSQNGKLFFMCIADGNEAAAIKKITNLFHSSVPGASNKESSKIKNTLPDIVCNQLYTDTDVLKMSNDLVNYAFEQPSPLCEQLRKIFIPPPRA